MKRPTTSEYAADTALYVALVPENDILSAMEQQFSEMQMVLSSLDETKARHRYADGKWSVKGVIGHLADAERVFGYRAMAIARGETEPLPPFDEELYARNASFDDWKIGDLAEEHALLRRANIVLFKNLRAEAWDCRGIANDAPVSVRGLAYVIVGHERHHRGVLRERYGI